MANTIQFHLSFNNGAQRLWLPVSPPSIGVSSSHGYVDVEAAQLGEYTVIGNRKSDEFTFSSFFPRDYDPSYCAYAPLPKPWDCVETIGHWMRTGEPVRLTITGTPINIAVTIRDFTYEPERGGNPGDIYYDITLKEYVFVKPRQLTFNSDSTVASAASSRPSTTGTATSYTVKSGDSLWKIAQRTEVYSDGDRWRTIYSANKALIGVNPSAISTGMKLVIPR